MASQPSTARLITAHRRRLKSRRSRLPSVEVVRRLRGRLHRTPRTRWCCTTCPAVRAGRRCACLGVHRWHARGSPNDVRLPSQDPAANRAPNGLSRYPALRAKPSWLWERVPPTASHCGALPRVTLVCKAHLHATSRSQSRRRRRTRRQRRRVRPPIGLPSSPTLFRFDPRRWRAPVSIALPLLLLGARRCYCMNSKSYRDATRAMTSGVSGPDCAALATSRM